MPNLTTVTLTNGAATAGSGTVSTLDNLVGTAGTPSAQVLSTQAPTSNLVQGAITTPMTVTTSTQLLAAPAASNFNYITTIVVSNAHATQGTDIALQDGSGGTTFWTIPAAANYGGAVITFNPPLKQTTSATALFCANVTSGASTKVSVNGFTGT